MQYMVDKSLRICTIVRMHNDGCTQRGIDDNLYNGVCVVVMQKVGTALRFGRKRLRIV